MTAREKAKSLISKYLDMHTISGGIGINEKQAKQCALITAYEVIENEHGVAGIPYSDNNIGYWKDVIIYIEES